MYDVCWPLNLIKDSIGFIMLSLLELTSKINSFLMVFVNWILATVLLYTLAGTVSVLEGDGACEARMSNQEYKSWSDSESIALITTRS